jgi:hypothetical protein
VPSDRPSARRGSLRANSRSPGRDTCCLLSARRPPPGHDVVASAAAYDDRTGPLSSPPLCSSSKRERPPPRQQQRRRGSNLRSPRTPPRRRQRGAPSIRRTRVASRRHRSPIPEELSHADVEGKAMSEWPAHAGVPAAGETLPLSRCRGRMQEEELTVNWGVRDQHLKIRPEREDTDQLC